MSFVTAQPELLAAGPLRSIGCPHAQLDGAVSARAAAIHELLVKTWGISPRAYTATAPANAAATG